VTRVVVDASVAVKWVLPGEPGEADVDEALALLGAVGSGDVLPLQPPHWLVEVAAVVARLEPGVAPRAVRLLHLLELPLHDAPETLALACRLATRLEQHVFDTLYHAVALSTDGARLVTADDRYYRKAQPFGAIVRLRDWAA